MAALQYFITFLSSLIIQYNAGIVSRRDDLHPTYIAVAQIDFNSQDKFATLLCKTFTDDMESALQKQFDKKVSVANAGNGKAIFSMIDTYIKGHLRVKINGREVSPSMTTYNKDENNDLAVYFRINDVENISNIEISDTIFYELYDSQIQIIYVTVNGNRKSNKIRNPASTVSFDF